MPENQKNLAITTYLIQINANKGLNKNSQNPLVELNPKGR